MCSASESETDGRDGQAEDRKGMRGGMSKTERKRGFEWGKRERQSERDGEEDDRLTQGHGGTDGRQGQTTGVSALRWTCWTRPPRPAPKATSAPPSDLHLQIQRSPDVMISRYNDLQIFRWGSKDQSTTY